MRSSTCSTDINLESALVFGPARAKGRRAGARRSAIRRGKRMAADPQFPSEAEIKRLAQQIIALILANNAGALDPPLPPPPPPDYCEPDG